MQRNRTFRLLLVLFATALVLPSAVCAADQGGTAAKITGADLVRLTTQGSFEIHPTWSRDGREVLFSSDNGGGLALCKIDASGKGEISQLTTQPSTLMSDLWMDSNRNDGRMIFASTRGGNCCGLYTVSADQTKPQPLAVSTGNAQFPSWSPDGKMIAFSATDEKNDWWVWTSSSDGSAARKLTRGIQPRWSPDGKRIAYAAETQQGSYDIYSISVDGSGAARITSDRRNELEPDWSPDGKMIAYVSTSDDPVMPMSAGIPAVRACDLCVVTVDNPGAAAVKLTAGSANLHPRWSPDGKRIVFASDRSGNWDVWYITLSN